MTRLDGQVTVTGTVAYAPQNPWIMSTSVRDNITFYRHFDEEFYNVVLDGESEPITRRMGDLRFTSYSFSMRVEARHSAFATRRLDGSWRERFVILLMKEIPST